MEIKWVCYVNAAANVVWKLGFSSGQAEAVSERYSEKDYKREARCCRFKAIQSTEKKILTNVS